MSDAEIAGPWDLRVVVDGASTAGKTTTARALGEIFGAQVTTPAERDGRTLLFDWLDHTAGNVDGRPVRTQLVAVPGHLPHLRARILETADVVLFVADTSRPGLEASARALAQVREVLAVLPPPMPALVVQANKRDADDVAPMDEVVEALCIGADEVVVETVATVGDGVRVSFVHAVRAGLARLRSEGADRAAERQRTAEALLEQLDLDPRPSSDRSPVGAAASPPGPTPAPDPTPGPAPDPSPGPAPDTSSAAPARRPSRLRRLLAGR